MKTFVSDFWGGPDRKRVFGSTMRSHAPDADELRARISVLVSMPGGMPLTLGHSVPLLIISRAAVEPAVEPGAQMDLKL